MNTRTFCVLGISMCAAACATYSTRSDSGVAANASPISTDRPGLLFASTVVPQGALQIEMGLPTVVDERQSRTTSWSAAARYGLADALELRLAATPYAMKAIDDSRDEDGSGDLELGFKAALARDPALALVGNVRLPTGESSFSSGDPVYSLFAVAETALDELHSLKGMAGVAHGPDGDGGSVESLALAVLVSRSLLPRLCGYVEAGYFPTLGSGPDPAFAGAGLAWLVTPDLQLDAGFDAGVDDDASDWIATLGLSVRW